MLPFVQSVTFPFVPTEQKVKKIGIKAWMLSGLQSIN